MKTTIEDQKVGVGGAGSDRDKSLEAEGLTAIKFLCLGLTGDFQPFFFGARKFPFAAWALKDKPIAKILEAKNKAGNWF